VFRKCRETSLVLRHARHDSVPVRPSELFEAIFLVFLFLHRHAATGLFLAHPLHRHHQVAQLVIGCPTLKERAEPLRLIALRLYSVLEVEHVHVLVQVRLSIVDGLKEL